MTEIDQAPAPVLPRELTEISDAVREVGAPPTPTLSEPYSIRLADPDVDAELVSEWMNRPHLAEAWEYDWPPGRWHRYLQRPTGRGVLPPVHRQLPRRRLRICRVVPGGKGFHRSAV